MKKYIILCLLILNHTTKPMNDGEDILKEDTRKNNTVKLSSFIDKNLKLTFTIKAFDESKIKVIIKKENKENKKECLEEEFEDTGEIVNGLIINMFKLFQGNKDKKGKIDKAIKALDQINCPKKGTWGKIKEKAFNYVKNNKAVDHVKAHKNRYLIGAGALATVGLGVAGYRNRESLKNYPYKDSLKKIGEGARNIFKK